MAKPKTKSQPATGQFKCGKCGAPFAKSHGLAIHILRTHKKSTWGKRSVSKPVASSSTSITCQSCGRTDFRNRWALQAHARFCKGRASAPARLPAVVTPSIRQAVERALTPTPPPEPAIHVHPNGNQIERLKAVAAQKRREADEIERLISSFEVSAQRYLSK